MTRTPGELRRDALRIWQAGVEAVRPDRLLAECLHVDGHWLLVGDEELDLRTIRRIAVVGAGKAGAGMAEAVENILGPKLCREIQLDGWVNVPADCVRPLPCINLHAARPAGVNEPRPEGVLGRRKSCGSLPRLARTIFACACFQEADRHCCPLRWKASRSKTKRLSRGT